MQGVVVAGFYPTLRNGKCLIQRYGCCFQAIFAIYRRIHCSIRRNSGFSPREQLPKVQRGWCETRDHDLFRLDFPWKPAVPWA